MSAPTPPLPRDVIRWGIIGCGDVTEVKSGPGFQKATGSALVAVMRRNAALAADYAKREGFADDGYRVVINCNDNGGQTVFQVHLHLLAGAPLGRFGTPS